MADHFVDLENYDGRGAYFHSGNLDVRYTIVEINNNKYAFISDNDIVQEIADSEDTQRRDLESRFPIFQILNEDLQAQKARAVNVNSQRKELEGKLINLHRVDKK